MALSYRKKIIFVLYQWTELRFWIRQSRIIHNLTTLLSRESRIVFHLVPVIPKLKSENDRMRTNHRKTSDKFVGI